MLLKIVLLVIGLASAIAAVRGLARGTIWCKGGPYARDGQPAGFWGSVAVYLAWTVLMVYFALFRGT